MDYSHIKVTGVRGWSSEILEENQALTDTSKRYQFLELKPQCFFCSHQSQDNSTGGRFITKSPIITPQVRRSPRHFRMDFPRPVYTHTTHFTEHNSITIHETLFSKSRLTFWGPRANYNEAPGYGAFATAQRRSKVKILLSFLLHIFKVLGPFQGKKRYCNN